MMLLKNWCEKAMEHANGADLIIYVVDSSVALDDNDYDIINFIKDKKAVILLNKSDLASNVSADDIKKLVDKTVISVSAKESLGIDELSDTIKNMFLMERSHSMMRFISQISGIKNYCQMLRKVLSLL